MSRTLVTSILALALGACSAPMPDSMGGMPQPTAQHKMLQQGVGTWEGTLTAYWPGADSKPVAAKQVVEAIGSFWTQSKFTCTMMGMPFVGTGCTGFDTETGRYVGTWIDNFTTELAVMSGEMDATGKMLIMRWTQRDPVTGMMAPQRSETTSTGDSFTSRFYGGAGQGTLWMVLDMKRQSH